MAAVTQTSTANLDLLVAQLGFTHFVIKANTSGLRHRDSLVQPAPGGNCLNWVLGHMLVARNEFMEFLGLEPLWDTQEREPYKRAGPPLADPDEAMAFDRLLADLDATQQALTEALGQLPGERLAEKAPSSPTNDPNETVGSLIAGFVFHDAYHAGQTGLLRRIAGREGAIG